MHCQLELNAAAGIERVHLRSSRLQIVLGQRVVLQVCSHAHDMQQTKFIHMHNTPLMLLRRPPHTFSCS